MTENLPAPLVPLEVDLSKLDGFMLDTAKLLGSELAAISTGDEFKAAVLLWCRSWKQVPAASLPDDERVLANFAGYGRDPRGWRKIREMALRGFVKCSDGRLYHRVLSRDALRAWENLKRRAERTQAATAARKAGSQSDRNDNRHDGDAHNVTSTVTSNVTTPHRQDRTGTGRDINKKKKEEGGGEPLALLAPQPGENSNEGAGKTPKRRTRIAEDWTLDRFGPLYAYAIENGMTHADIETESEKFFQHWKASGETKADWDATWRTWVLRWKSYPRKEAKRA